MCWLVSYYILYQQNPIDSIWFNRCDVIYDTQHCSRECDLLVLHPVPQTGTLEGCHWCHRCKIRFQQPSDSCDSSTSMIDFNDWLHSWIFLWFYLQDEIDHFSQGFFWREALITLLSNNSQTMTPRKANMFCTEADQSICWSPSLIDPFSSSIVNPMQSHQENLYAHDISLLKFKDF